MREQPSSQRQNLYDVAHAALRTRPEWDEVGGLSWDDYLGDLAATAVDAVLNEQQQDALSYD